MNTTYTHKEVIEIIETLLERPYHLDDAIHNENTEWDAESLLELALIELVNTAQAIERRGVLFKNINQPK